MEKLLPYMPAAQSNSCTNSKELEIHEREVRVLSPLLNPALASESAVPPRRVVGVRAGQSHWPSYRVWWMTGLPQDA